MEKWKSFDLGRITSIWNRIPEQFRRLAIVAVILLVLPLVVGYILIPHDFGKYGHYRASAVDDIIAQQVQYASHDLCVECHDDVGELKNSSYHRTVMCEVCHGPGKMHTEAPDEVQLEAPRGRGYCPLCHEYLPSRPTGFPQIVSASHNPIKPCITCHDPHDPTPPETPKECSACHATIARTKMISHHAYIPCTRCHDVPEEHKISPRDNLPSKPKTRQFCGQCHAEDAASPKGIPRVDLATHEERYVCWQCHYPHLPEAR